jgi:hypothetical protein
VDPEVFNNAKMNVQNLIQEYTTFVDEDDDDEKDPKNRKARKGDQYGGVMFK